MKQAILARMGDHWTERGFISQTAKELGATQKCVSYHCDALLKQGKVETLGTDNHRKYRLIDSMRRQGAEDLALTIKTYWVARGYIPPEIIIDPLSLTQPSQFTIRSNMKDGLPV